MMYYEEEVEKERCNQAHKTLQEISTIIDKHYNKTPRTKLNNELDKLKTENRKLKQELYNYKKIIEGIEILKKGEK